MLFVWYKVSFDEKWSHDSAVCETVYFLWSLYVYSHGNAYL